MLLEYTCSNYKSIKDKVVFSLLSDKNDHSHSENVVPCSNKKVLRSSIIYGANGSGKTNFLDSIGFMAALVSQSIHKQPGEIIPQFPHKLSEHNVPTVFKVQFVRHGIRYSYGFSILDNFIDGEYLYYFPKKRRVKIFERDGMRIIPGDRYKKAFDVSLGVLKENRLFLSCAANYTNLSEIEEAFLFFIQDIVIYNKDINNWTDYSINLMKKNKAIKQKFIELLQQFGTGIKNISSKTEKVKIDAEPIPNELKGILPSEVNRITVKVDYGRFQTDLSSEESDGIQKLFELLCPIIDILANDKVLLCDELENSLHESLVYQIIQMFHQEGSQAQLIFSTHDTSLLSTDIFRRDQIWFTQLTEERATDLYSLIEFKNLGELENIEKGYIAGKYGAIPFLNTPAVNQFSER